MNRRNLRLYGPMVLFTLKVTFTPKTYNRHRLPRLSGSLLTLVPFPLTNFRENEFLSLSITVKHLTLSSFFYRVCLRIIPSDTLSPYPTLSVDIRRRAFQIFTSGTRRVTRFTFQPEKPAP